MSEKVGPKQPSGPVRRHAKRESRQRGRLHSVTTESVKEQQVRKYISATLSGADPDSYVASLPDFSGVLTVWSRFQARSREEREAKRARMDGRHDFILSTVADKVGISLEEAEDFVLEGNQVKRQLFNTSV